MFNTSNFVAVCGPRSNKEPNEDNTINKSSNEVATIIAKFKAHFVHDIFHAYGWMRDGYMYFITCTGRIVCW